MSETGHFSDKSCNIWFAILLLFQIVEFPLEGRLHLRNTQKYLVFRSICTTFAADFEIGM